MVSRQKDCTSQKIIFYNFTNVSRLKHSSPMKNTGCKQNQKPPSNILLSQQIPIKQKWHRFPLLSTKSTNWSFKTQKKVAFFRVGFHVVVVKPCNKLTGCYLSFRNNCINVGSTSVWSCIVRSFSIPESSHSSNILTEFISKSNGPKVESCETPNSILICY